MVDAAEHRGRLPRDQQAAGGELHVHAVAERHRTLSPGAPAAAPARGRWRRASRASHAAAVPATTPRRSPREHQHGHEDDPHRTLHRSSMSPSCIVGPRTQRPVGTITRGTTNPNRLRRVDRWIAGPLAPRWRSADAPLVVDLGYGATPVTAVELHDRLRRVRSDVEVVGLEIDPARVAAAQPLARPVCRSRSAASRCPCPAVGTRTSSGPSTCCGSTTRARSPTPGRRCATGSPPAACWSTARATRSDAGPRGSR